MNKNTTPPTITTSDQKDKSPIIPPFIQRKIDGRVFTVVLHFATDTNDTIYDKLGRVFLRDLESGNLKDS